ncbi:hypothetical protein G6F62_010827 [Rhizopus arrhizus]|uniref:C2H2-type domain-containing protein n=1 Tax=Rhizopus oryzae TaxID=64495 RepID=A0A9P6X704_RHIOR|nr:hypothetical protein G6F23_011336 [Rhizopus arrhizus]KAG0753470.1 hypothetical protein G6F24_012977 [Rhizopus arrhizus]KAG0787628.1 hypothetical protein G6F21_007780 [Rhizopus arrhizus]KAG0815051.1 hypothetical protein G6F20_004298 [Rhizopus arrhizus]KAG0826972.1 hypothetical protein G6F19_009041 [Rhizopus arrhizus]
MMTKEHRFRVRVQDHPLLDFSLCLLKEPCQTVQLNDLVHRIYLHTKNEIQNLKDYDITMKRNHVSYRIQDDIDLQNALNSTATHVEIELHKKIQHQPICLAQPTYHYHRKDSGISLSDEPLDIKKPSNPINLPRLSTIIESIPPFYPSPYCKKRRMTSPTLLLPNETPFTCQHVMDPATGRVCRQAFRRSYDLSRHQMIHLKNRPFFYCSDCDRKFTRLDALRRHERIQGHSCNNKK